MAFSTANISAAEIAGIAADKALFVVQSASFPGDAHWTTTGAATGTDVTDADFPAVRAYDSIGSLATKTTGVASTSPKYFNFYFGATTSISFDSLLILGHNFESIDITTITLEIADNTDFDENVREIAKYEPGSDVIDNRIVFTHLNTVATTITESGGGVTINTDKTVTVTATSALRQGDAISGSNIPSSTYIESITDSTHIEITNAATGSGSGLNFTFTQYDYNASGTAQRYSSVQNVRLRLLHSGSKAPHLGEIILGTRYQLQRNPDLPYDDLAEISEIAEAKSLSGLVRRYVVYKGQALRNFVAPISSATEITVIENWWNAIEEGTKPFVYIETPTTDPKAYLMTMETPALVFPKLGPYERQLSFSMIEQPPFLASE
tara:strand:- start:201 stop:1340 length:1140 start_codon:yes stop_codon:yes gene_type:complete